MITKKVCSKCKELKPLDEFYKNRGTHDGHTSECKVCGLARTKIYQATEQGKTTIKKYLASDSGKMVKRKASARANKTEKRRISNRRNDAKRSGTEQRKKSHNRAATRYRHNSPHKVKARSAVNIAIRKGTLPSPKTLKCYDCGVDGQHYDHHKGYDKENWLDVQAVCTKCHALRHRSNN